MPSWAGSNAAMSDSTSPMASSSITSDGGTRPPRPITVSAIVAPGPSGTTRGPVISVVVRLAVDAPPGRNSSTSPLTRTALPTAALAGGAAPVKTKTASEVRGSPSATGSWR